MPTQLGRLTSNVPEGPTNSELPALDALVPSPLIFVPVIAVPERVPENALRTNPGDAGHVKIAFAPDA